ncbi:MAG TPA: bifunctional phosphopantothenoylcysteine decarboxylase/phosphopantothenate--cysteine ligase CoaBC [Pseudolysinimonas sp.]|nr:bifunctional phosphopantothenoylcysteine decarboxylase/phosphopantothenate--cysteine ligase CoaBC [Pseudolysinimonas sp.]
MNIVVGVTGGIAAYKAVQVIRLLVLAGHDVHVIATEAALRFVGKPTFEAISRNPVHSDLYDGVSEVRHVALGQNAELIVIAPATAHTLAALAHGLSDDLLGTTVLASSAPILVAPAMHTEMWMNPATVANVELLRSRGVNFIGPNSGELTGLDAGPGRMAEPSDIVSAAIGAVTPRDLAGKRVLITAGGTREPLDPVRFIGNRSSGKQGVALARAAAWRGADVTLVVANIDAGVLTDEISGVTVHHVSSTLELRELVQAEAPTADVIIMAAAVADYRPESVADTKISKESQGDSFVVHLVKNPDILQELALARRPRQLIIGFAAETEVDDEALLRRGVAKIARKGVDYLVINRVGWNEGFGTDSNVVLVLGAGGDIVAQASGPKSLIADRILDLAV